MKNKYLNSHKPGWSGRLWVLLTLLWITPLLGQAQTSVFTENMDDSGVTATSRELVSDYTARGGFTYDQAGSQQGSLTYAGTALTATSANSTGYTGASGGTSIFFGGAAGTDPGTPPYSFSINGANTSQLTDVGVTFGLYTPNGDNPGSGLFSVEYTTNGVAYTNVSYTRTTNNTIASGNTWNLYTVSFTSGSVTPSTTFGLRFTRTSSATGNRLYRLDDVKLTGTVSSSPVISASESNLIFGNSTIVGTTSAPMTFTASAQSLTAPLLINASANYLISTSNGGPYQSSLTVNPVSGTVPATTIYVVFQPTASGSSNGSVTLSSTGATAKVVNTFATAQSAPATLSVNPDQLAFPSIQVGQVSSVQSFTIVGNNLGTTPVIVNAPAGFQVRLPSGMFATSVTLTPSSSAVNQVIETRFTPNSAITYNDVITVTSGSTATSVEVTGTGTPAPSGPFIVVNPSSLDFGTVSNSGSAQTLTFAVNAGNLTAPLTLTGSNNIIVFRDASAGGGFVNGPITINPAPDGSVSIRDIEVRLVAPVGTGAFSGSITASSAGAPNAEGTIGATSTGGNSTINVSSTDLNQFSTVPGVASDVQFYTVTGTNLLEDLVVAAPQYFQISLNPNFTGITGTGNSFVLARSAIGDVPNTTIYVRFLPPSALSVTSNVLNSSSPATAQAVRANGTSEPSIQIENPFQQVTNVVINTKSASQALTINAKRVLKPINISKLLTANSFNISNYQQFELSLDNVTFTNNITLIPNTSSYTVNQLIYVRYAPTYLGTGESTLQFQSDDFANSSIQSFGSNGVLSGRSIDTEPTKRSNATIVRSGQSATVTFALPANYAAQGYGESRLIVASLNPQLASSGQPQDGVSYTTGNQTYGQGPQIAPGYFVVYAGANNSVIVDGLNPAATYYFYTFEFNNIENGLTTNTAVSTAENYLSPPTPNQIPGIESPGEPPLPVTLVSFSAKLKGDQVALRWETASELNNKQFEIERSRDGRSFETILTRTGQGTTNSGTVYNEVDRQPLNGLSYYRLKQVDLDGKTSYSGLATISFLKAGDVVMYPNPVSNQLTITMGGSTEGVSATITDLTGRIIRTQSLPTDGKLSMTDLQAGTYLITVGTGKYKVTRRVVKQ